MKKLLYIVGSPRESASESSNIANAFLKQYKETNPDAVIDELNLWKEKIPAFDGNKAAAKMTFLGQGVLEGKLITAWDEIVEITDRFKSADDYLITVPMWNGGIPWALKQYIDTITQNDLTFDFGPNGYSPLLENKKACVVYTSSVYSPVLPKSFGLDYQVSYMNWWLELIGVTTVYNVTLLSTAITQSLEQDRHLAIVKASAIAKHHFAA
ncbi:FMN-dependent NADH-azoreductase [Mucilaginibacter sp. McL0603]|uniref:FMN-dependent NADH-azoreductase n=1 Tax=Mucilaginibacter sp. McL0603 TaxID=3415670 RepID=UPI003CF105D3